MLGKLLSAAPRTGASILTARGVSHEDLRGLLEEVKSINKDTPVLVRADEVTQFKKVTEVWDACRSLGLNKVVMQVRQ